MANVINASMPHTHSPASIGAVATSTFQSHLDNHNNPHNVTAEQIGAAPSGYGLGTVAEYLIDVDLNTVTQNGWYRLASTCANYPTTSDSVAVGGGTLMEVTAGGGSYITIQRIYLGTGNQQGLELRRYYNNALAEWSPWEWVNPRMAEGKEYRTTERIGAKAVYKKIVDGVIQYRLDGETEWKPYGEVLGESKIQTGTYTGTGTYGSSSKNSLTFNFVPKIVIVQHSEVANISGEEVLIWQGQTGSDGSTDSVICSLTGKTLEWYNAYSQIRQLNESGSTYLWTAWG